MTSDEHETTRIDLPPTESELPPPPAPRVPRGVRVLRRLEASWALRTAFGCLFLGMGVGLVIVSSNGGRFLTASDSTAVPAVAAPGVVAAGIDPATQPACASPNPAGCFEDGSPLAVAPVSPVAPDAATGKFGDAPVSSDTTLNRGAAYDLFVVQYPSAAIAKVRRTGAKTCFAKGGIVGHAVDAATSRDPEVQSLVAGVTTTKNLVAFTVQQRSTPLPYVQLPACISADATTIISSAIPSTTAEVPGSGELLGAPAGEPGPAPAPVPGDVVDTAPIDCNDPKVAAMVLDDTGVPCEEYLEKLR